MSTNRNSGAQAPGFSKPLAAGLKPTKDEAPAVGAARGFKNQDTKDQSDSPREAILEQTLTKQQQDLRTLQQQLRKLQRHLGRRAARTYLTRLRLRKVDPDEELARAVSSMSGYMLESFCHFLERALREGLYAKAQLAEAKRVRLTDFEQALFERLAMKFASSGYALLRKKAADGSSCYCAARESGTTFLRDLDAAERFLQQNTMGGCHVAD